MSTKHTPGELELLGDHGDVIGVCIYNRETGHMIKIVASMTSTATHHNEGDWREVEANACLIKHSWNSYVKHCGDRAVECAEGDLLGESLDLLEHTAASLESCIAHFDFSMTRPDVASRNALVERAKAVLAKARRDP